MIETNFFISFLSDFSTGRGLGLYYTNTHKKPASFYLFLSHVWKISTTFLKIDRFFKDYRGYANHRTKLITLVVIGILLHLYPVIKKTKDKTKYERFFWDYTSSIIGVVAIIFTVLNKKNDPIRLVGFFTALILTGLDKTWKVLPPSGSFILRRIMPIFTIFVPFAYNRCSENILAEIKKIEVVELPIIPLL